MYYTPLSQRRLIHLTGADTTEFLQGIVSNDVRPVSQGQMVYAAMLTPQGKFLYDFFMLPWQDGIALDVDSTRADELLARLKMYRLRSQVEIAPLPESYGVCALWGRGEIAATPDNVLDFPDPRLPSMGWRVVGDLGIMQSWFQGFAQHTDSTAYERHRLEHAIPDGARDMIVDKTLLLEVGFEQLSGVDFSKGCYVGQEVTARSKFRAQLRKSLYAVCIAGNLPKSETPVTVGGREIGMLRTVLGGIGLAILQVEEVEKARWENTPIMAGDVIIEVAIPSWMGEATTS